MWIQCVRWFCDTLSRQDDVNTPRIGVRKHILFDVSAKLSWAPRKPSQASNMVTTKWPICSFKGPSFVSWRVSSSKVRKNMASCVEGVLLDGCSITTSNDATLPRENRMVRQANLHGNDANGYLGHAYGHTVLELHKTYKNRNLSGETLDMSCQERVRAIRPTKNSRAEFSPNEWNGQSRRATAPPSQHHVLDPSKTYESTGQHRDGGRFTWFHQDARFFCVGRQWVVFHSLSQGERAGKGGETPSGASW